MQKDFEKQLIKGRIAETIFELMFREMGDYDVLPLGYEQTTPVLAQYQHEFRIKKILDNIKDSPDYALLSQDKKKLYIVEVKYRKHLDKQIVKTAKDMAKKWDPSWIFLATSQGFYFEQTSKISKNEGYEEQISEKWVSKELQEKYKKLLNKFIE